MTDPLSLLRQCIADKKEIVDRDNQIILGEFSLPKNIKINYLVKGSGKDGDPKEYYTLECLVFLLRNVTLPHPVYVRRAIGENISFVRRPDRKDLLAYLNGQTATSSSIDESARLVIPTRVKRTTEGYELPVAKKPQYEETQVLKVKEQPAAQSDEFSTVGNVKSLSEVLSAEKIAAIKEKRLAKIRATMKDNESIGLSPGHTVMDDFTSNMISHDTE